MKRVAIITSSDTGYRGEREDLSGPAIREIVEKNGYKVVSMDILPDDRAMLSKKMAELADNNTAELILTTGGTGFSPRDIMPEATEDIIDRRVPGIPEAMRAYSMTITKRAMLSRATAGIRKKTLIVNLPGSPKAVKESLEYIIDPLAHGIEIPEKQETAQDKRGGFMGKVIAVCTSEKKGTQKTSVPKIDVREDWGIQGDAHAGKWHRQVSLLSYEKIEAFRARGAEIEDGAFGENIIVQGIDFATLPVGTKFACNDVVLELTQIGKECHSGCAIFKKMGECIMPKQGVFTKVLHGGIIRPGDELTILE